MVSRKGWAEELVRTVCATATQGPASMREALLAQAARSGIEDDRTVLVARVEPA